MEVENEDLTEEEKNPVWLKDKAKYFYNLIQGTVASGNGIWPLEYTSRDTDVKTGGLTKYCILKAHNHDMYVVKRRRRQTHVVFIFCSSFFKAGDYQSAVNVYSHAIRLNPKLFSYPLQVSKLRDECRWAYPREGAL